MLYGVRHGDRKTLCTVPGWLYCWVLDRSAVTSLWGLYGGGV